VIPWLDEEMAVVCPPQHRFAKLAKVSVKQLDGETFVAFENELVIRKKVDQFLKGHGVHVKVMLRFDNIEAVKRGVEAGTGISILPRPTLEHELRLGTLVAVPFAGARFVRPLGIVHRKGKKLYPNTEAFVELLRNGHGHPEGRKGQKT
jgi:DNA-binding transcriptional LysR family regulator